MPEKRKNIILFVLILILVGVYINRSYSHIFDYNESRSILASDLIKEYSLENGKGQQTLTYVALGDSLTYGLGASNTVSTYPYIIAEDLLNEYKTINVYNLGISGATASELITYQLPRAIELKPDFVTIMIGTNDVHDYIDKEDFRQSLETILDELQKNTDAEILLINIPYLGTDSLILPPHNIIMDNRIKEFSKVIAEIAASKNIELFDLYNKSYEPFKKNQKLYYSIDEFHPSNEGYIFWGNLINGN